MRLATPSSLLRFRVSRPRGARGSALLVTLGMLAIATMLVFAFVLVARTERIAARQARDRATARHHLDTALGIVMSYQLPLRLQGIDGNHLASANGLTGGFDRWAPYGQDGERHFLPNLFTSYESDRACPTKKNFLDGPATNYLPASLHKEARKCDADWLPIETVDETSRAIIGTNALYAFAVVDVSGFLDANEATTNELSWLKDAYGTDIEDLAQFLEDRARHVATAEKGMRGGYRSLRDLVLRNRGVRQPAGFLFPASYDPASDVTITNGSIYSDYYHANRRPELVPKFDLNSWTNGFRGDRDDPDALGRHYASEDFRENWLREVTNRLDFCGFAAAVPIAWNLVNFMDADRVPQGPSEAPWQEAWPVEDVPLLNEVAVAQVPLAFGSTNAYAAAVELWYPFATNAITADDEVQVVVAVYTNWPWAGKADAWEHFGKGWTNSVMWPGEEFGLTFSNKVERMAYGTSEEYVTATQPEPYVTFPRTIWSLSETNTGGKAYGPWGEGGTWATVAPTPDAEERMWLIRREVNLPLGIQTFTTYVQREGMDVWDRRVVTVTNEIRLLARVMVGGRWADEAMSYNPAPDSPFSDPPYAYRTPGGFEIDDPRLNGLRRGWTHYEGLSVTEDEEGNETFSCTLSGTTNSVCNPWHEYGQGLPIVHYDGPLLRAGDVGYIQEPYGTVTGELRTNRWQSICLADGRALAHRGNFTYSAGSALEFFTVRCATNSPLRGLVNAATPWNQVVGALAADFRIDYGAGGRLLSDYGAGGRLLPDEVISWVTNFYSETRTPLFKADSIPIGVGDLCMAVGFSKTYHDAEELDQEGVEEVWRRFRGNWGNEVKEDILREFAERLTFRQQLYVVILDARTTTPAMTVSAEQKATALVLRDAYSGAWRVLGWHYW